MLRTLGRKGFVSFWREDLGVGGEEQHAFLQTARHSALLLPQVLSTESRSGQEQRAAGPPHCSALGFVCGSCPLLHPLAALPVCGLFHYQPMLWDCHGI